MVFSSFVLSKLLSDFLSSSLFSLFSTLFFSFSFSFSLYSSSTSSIFFNSSICSSSSSLSLIIESSSSLPWVSLNIFKKSISVSFCDLLSSNSDESSSGKPILIKFFPLVVPSKIPLFNCNVFLPFGFGVPKDLAPKVRNLPLLLNVFFFINFSFHFSFCFCISSFIIFFTFSLSSFKLEVLLKTLFAIFWISSVLISLDCIINLVFALLRAALGKVLVDLDSGCFALIKFFKVSLSVNKYSILFWNALTFFISVCT